LSHLVTAPTLSQLPLLDEQLLPSSRAIWIVGALGAITIHAAGGLLAFYYSQHQADDLGAPGFVIDVDLAAPRRDAENLPVGPDTQASVTTPAVGAKAGQRSNRPAESLAA
jgi:hypothetical protein